MRRNQQHHEQHISPEDLLVLLMTRQVQVIPVKEVQVISMSTEYHNTSIKQQKVNA